MANNRLGHFDTTDLHAMAKSLRTTAKQWDQFMSEQIKWASEVMDGKVKLHTPVKDGELRRAWRIASAKKIGDAYVVTMTNSKEYAMYVNNGHRTCPGKTRDGEPKKQKWVEGQFFVEAAIAEMESELESHLEEALIAFMVEWGLS